MPTLGLSTFSIGPELQARESLDFVLRHEFHGLELDAHAMWPEVIDTKDRREFRSLAAANGVELSIHFLHREVAPASHQPERRARHRLELEHTLEIACDIGAGVVVIHPGPIDCPGVEPTEAPEAVRREARENLRQFLEETAPKAQEAGVIICVENMHHVPGQVIQTYAELLEVVQAVSNPAVQITLDTGHADRADGVTDALDTFAPYLRHVHIHDSNGQRDHLEIGRGNLDFGQWLDHWRDYPFSMVLESGKDDDPQASVLRSRDRLKNIFGSALR